MKRIVLGLLIFIFFSGTLNSAEAKSQKRYSYKGDYYAVGVDAFNKGIYDNAQQNFEHAIRLSPKNVNARYYLAQIYLRKNRILDASEQYKRIIILAPTSEAAIYSQKGLSLIKQASLGIKIAAVSDNEFEKYQDNYIDYVLSNEGKIMKWQSFPVNVYIEDKASKDLAKKAFDQWQEKSDKLANFNYVNTPESAQITVSFKDKLESTSTKETYIAGYSKPYYQGDYLAKSEISILTVDPDSKQPLDNDSIFSATLHEIGHSLGFKGHSPNSNDIMFASASTSKIQLTQRDLNTLYVFYKINQDALLAKSKGKPDLKLQQALNYVKATPDKSVGWANLADLYRGKKMYSEAINAYQKAISLEPNKPDFYNLIGVTYLSKGDTENAFKNLKKACDLDKNNIYYLYQFANFCANTGQKELGKIYLDEFIKANPKSVSDEKINKLLKIYN